MRENRTYGLTRGLGETLNEGSRGLLYGGIGISSIGGKSLNDLGALSFRTTFAYN